jgi:MoaA/NifB/PqqE/SkfB family radical SAM enzyme
MSKNQPYCLMPWIHFHVGDDGAAKACCVANIPFGNINTDNFEQIWNGEPISQLREKFAAGVIDKRCAQCYKLEETGGKSIRQETIDKFGPINLSQGADFFPFYFDIRFSNVCNLKCRTCWHGASSLWFEDAKKLGTNKGNKAIIKNITDFDKFIDQVGPHLVNAKEIYLAGGEPLVTEEHYLLLQWLLDNGGSQVHLRYNTNFTTLSYKAIDVVDLWKQFKSVTILASIDAPDSLGTYIRSGTDWMSIVNNHQKIAHLAHIDFQISPTISVLNLSHLPQLIEECITLNLITEDDIYINILERPIHYNIQILPKSIKESVLRKLVNFKEDLKSKKLKNQLAEICDYMNHKDLSKHWHKFETENGKIDSIRTEVLPLKF